MTWPWKSQKVSQGPQPSSHGDVPLGTPFEEEFVLLLEAVSPTAASSRGA